MRFIRPYPGECADRQTILALKIEHGALEQKGVSVADQVPKSSINIQPFIDENELIQQYLEKNWFAPQEKMEGTLGERYDELFDQLAEVNRQLWKLEDEARALRASIKTEIAMYRSAEVLFEITAANDERADLVFQINTLFGVGVQEKLYA